MRVDRKEQGFEWPACGAPSVVEFGEGAVPPAGDNFWNFQVQNLGYYACLLQNKLYLWPESGTGELNRPLGG